MSEREYYKRLSEDTANGNCDKCLFGCVGECHIQCGKSFEDYEREERAWLRKLGSQETKEMKIILYDKRNFSRGWDGKPARDEYECESVKVEGTKITILINKYNQIIWSTKYCDLEVVG